LNIIKYEEVNQTNNSGHLLPKERFIKRNKKLWQRTVIVSLLAMFIQISITPDIAVAEKVVVKEIIYKERPPLKKVDPKEIAKELFDEKQYTCLVKLLTRESNWRPEAKNPKSTASGIGQLLDGTYKNLGMKKSDEGVVQLVATLSYIHRRHVNPCNAWRHFQEKRWY
jgi:hypothetical protein